MTALNCIVERDAVHLFTDTGLYDDDGTLHGFAEKVAILPQGAVLGFSGLYDDAVEVGRRLSLVPADELATVFPRVVAEVVAHPRTCIAVLAKTSTWGPVAYAFLRRPSGDRFTQIASSLITPAVSVARLNGETTEAFGTRILEAQREGLFSPAGAPAEAAKLHIVGGSGQQTVLTSEGVASPKTLVDWHDDQIGQVIRPGLHAIDADEILIDGTLITDLIDDYAISNWGGSVAGGGGSLPLPGSETTMHSYVHTPYNGITFVTATVMAWVSTTGDDEYRFRLKRNGSIVASVIAKVDDIPRTTIVLSYSDGSPGTSAITWTMTVENVDVAKSENLLWEPPSITVLNGKK